MVGEVDPSGNLTSSGTFYVYGAKRAGGSTGTATTKQGFVGQLGHVTDSETGLVYMRARYYNPGIGRFVSEDSKGDTNNWFIYCSDNPVNMCDVTGSNGVPADDWGWYWSGNLFSTMAVASAYLGITSASAVGRILGAAGAVAFAAAAVACYVMSLGGITGGSKDFGTAMAPILAAAFYSLVDKCLGEGLKEAGRLAECAGAVGLTMASAVIGAALADTAALYLVDHF